MPKFLKEILKFPNGHIVDNGWWKIRGNNLVNRYGGYHSYTPSPDDIIVEAKSIYDLDYSYLIDDSSKTGWLAPDGSWYPCAPMDHAAVMKFILHEHSERALELKGYIKVFRNCSRLFNLDRDCHPIEFFAYKGASDKQKEKLLELGFSEKDIDYQGSVYRRDIHGTEIFS